MSASTDLEILIYTETFELEAITVECEFSVYEGHEIEDLMAVEYNKSEVAQFFKDIKEDDEDGNEQSLDGTYIWVYEGITWELYEDGTLGVVDWDPDEIKETLTNRVE